MAVYVVDSSALVKRYVRETGTAWVRGLTEPVAGHILYIAGITGVEVVSALIRQTRNGALAPTDTAQALAQFRQDFAYQRVEPRSGEVYAGRGSRPDLCWHRQ